LPSSNYERHPPPVPAPKPVTINVRLSRNSGQPTNRKRFLNFFQRHRRLGLPVRILQGRKSTRAFHPGMMIPGFAGVGYMAYRPPQAVHCAWRSLIGAADFSRVPDLTGNADIKLNARLSLRPIQTSLPWRQVAQMAISPRLSTARLGAASCPKGGPAPTLWHGVADDPKTGISSTRS